MKCAPMHRVRLRVIAGAVALAVLVSACASGSDGDANTIEAPATETTAAPAPSASAPEEPDDDEVAESESTPSLPANIWPEDIVETSEVETSDVDQVADVAGDKEVVTLAPGVEGVGVLPEGVDSVTAVVTSSDGEVCEVCLWLADDDRSRQRGLMGVTDLGDAVGMAFVWDQPREGNFFMFQTPTPLSIAWFDDAGSYVSQADMDPCLVDNSATCQRYTAGSPYVVAVEMFRGQLDVIGIGPGASIELLDLPCV